MTVPGRETPTSGSPNSTLPGTDQGTGWQWRQPLWASQLIHKEPWWLAFSQAGLFPPSRRACVGSLYKCGVQGTPLCREVATFPLDWQDRPTLLCELAAGRCPGEKGRDPARQLGGPGGQDAPDRHADLVTFSPAWVWSSERLVSREGSAPLPKTAVTWAGAGPLAAESLAQD